MPAGEIPVPVPDQLDPGEKVTVRMYRRILGDCFLLSHTRADAAKPYHALIDCGALQRIGKIEGKEATQASLNALGEAIDDLLDHVGGALDLVIATHEHYDHLSGFMKYHKKFKDLKIAKLWLAWTENKNDSVARDIDQGRNKGLAALAALTGRNRHGIAAANFGLGKDEHGKEPPELKQIENMLQFYGEIDLSPIASEFGLRAAEDQTLEAKLEPGASPRSCKQALLWLKQTAGEANTRYLMPGEQVAFGLGDRLRATVLGPPRTASRLIQLDPKGKGEDKEIYLADHDEIDALLATMNRAFDGKFEARAKLDDEDEDEAEEADSLTEVFTPIEPDQPFAARFARQVDPDSDDPDLRPRDPASRRYYAKDKSARRIDGDWLGAAQTLALKIDDDVNNTSLVLAIDTPGKHVLLFPADAQVGNWLSWHDQNYPSKFPDKNPDGETAADILSRVVLYKVGHHGSHNATLKDRGLELMTNPNLAAMIPVVSKVAAEQSTATNKDGWAMPYEDLAARLRVKTGGRIVKGDGDPSSEANAFTNSIFGKPDYDPKLPADPCWVALTLRGSDS